MSAELVAAKAAIAVVSDKRGCSAIAIILCSIIICSYLLYCGVIIRENKRNSRV